MAKARIREKGIVLFIVLVTIFIAILLGNILMAIIASQSRLTHHQISRIQAYYAAWAGINYAGEMLRIGPPTGWSFASCPDPGGCTIPDTNFPSSIQSVKVIFCPSGTTCAGTSTVCLPPTGINFCINSTANYTYTP